ncbi:MAG: helix-turn-helix domain-containing protein [Bdellovibrionales bacterium]
MNMLKEDFFHSLELQRQEDELKLRSLTIKRWLRTNEVALYLGITIGAVRVMTHRGQLFPKKYCGRNYYCRNEIDELIGNSNSKQTRSFQWR